MSSGFGDFLLIWHDSRVFLQLEKYQFRLFLFVLSKIEKRTGKYWKKIQKRWKITKKKIEIELDVFRKYSSIHDQLNKHY